MKAVHMLGFVQLLMPAIDSAAGAEISVDEVRDVLQNGDIFLYLRQRLGDSIDLSRFGFRGFEIEGEIRAWLKDYAIAFDSRERMKFGVEKSGLLLLLAYALDIMMMHMDTSAEIPSPE